MPRLEKGSKEAKEKMAHLRSLRKGKTIKETGDNGDEKPNKKMGMAGKVDEENVPTAYPVQPKINVVAKPESHAIARKRKDLEKELAAVNDKIYQVFHIGVSEEEDNKYVTYENRRKQIEHELRNLYPNAIEVHAEAEAYKDDKKEGNGMKQKSPWVKFVANYAKQHNMSFFTALNTDEVKKQYHSQK